MINKQINIIKSKNITPVLAKKNPKKNKIFATHCMNALAEVVKKPLLILDDKFRILIANKIFLQTFKIGPDKILGMQIFKLKNSNWNIPGIKKLLKEVLSNRKPLNDIEIKHDFGVAGKKVILLNANQVDDDRLIILTVEDITDRKKFENKLIQNAKKLEAKVIERTTELTERLKSQESLNKMMINRELKMVELKKEIERLKRKVANG